MSLFDGSLGEEMQKYGLDGSTVSINSLIYILKLESLANSEVMFSDHQVALSSLLSILYFP